MKRDFVEERRSKILGYVNEHNRADISELARIFGTTEATIRRDLGSLEEQSLVYRVHGGALRREQPSVWRITSLQDRLGAQADHKERIAEVAAELIDDGDSIMLDTGSTTMIVAQHLLSKKNLLFVTNAPAIGTMIGEESDHKVILTGGELLNETSALMGSGAEGALRHYRTDKAIVGVSGILLNEGCFAAIPEEAEVKRLMSLNAGETIVVADSTKFGTRALCFIFDFAHVDKLVTDKNISRTSLASLRDEGVEVLVA